MKKTLFALTLAAMGVAHAEPTTFTITAQGAYFSDFWHLEDGWDPSAKLVVSFTGEDLNRDSIITSDELTSLTASGNQFFNIEFLTPSNATTRYEIARFSYHSPQDFHIVATRDSYYPEGGWVNGQYIGLSQDAQSWGWSDDFMRSATWTSTDDTVVTVVSSVPEPATIAMLGLGLSLVGLAARRRSATGR